MALVLTFTTAGLNKFTAAQAGDDIDLTVATVGVTGAEFVPAPTLTGLPGEIKRIDTVSGAAVSDSIVHMTMRDVSADTYTVRGLGLYLADGTLFAVYGQTGPIVEKSTVSAILLALDIIFPAGAAGLIQFGDTNFLYPPATESTKGVAELASQAETDAGSDDERIVTPKKLATRLAAAISDFVSSTRKISVGGIATGGGDLTADRTITVPAASAEEVDAGELTTKAVVPASLVNVLAAIGARALKSRKISVGGLATGGGDLTADRTITVPAASAAEADAGELTTKALVPASLFNILQAIGARALSSRSVSTAGLASGGGDLTADRTITVTKASISDVLAATADDKAVTPAGLGGLGHSYGGSGYHVFPGGLIVQWSSCTHDAAGNAAITFPIAFPHAALGAVATNAASGPPTAWPGVGAFSATGMTVYAAQAAGVAPPAAGIGSVWFAWGY